MIKKVLTSLGICSAFVTAGFAISNVKAIEADLVLGNNVEHLKDYRYCKYLGATNNVKNRLKEEQYDELSDVANGSVYLSSYGQLFVDLKTKNISYDYDKYTDISVDGFVKTRDEIIDEVSDYESYENNSNVENNMNCKVMYDNYEANYYISSQGLRLNGKCDYVEIEIPISFEYSVYDADTFVSMEYGSVRFRLYFAYHNYINNQYEFDFCKVGGVAAYDVCCGAVALHNAIKSCGYNSNFFDVLDYLNNHPTLMTLKAETKKVQKNASFWSGLIRGLSFVFSPIIDAIVPGGSIIISSIASPVGVYAAAEIVDANTKDGQFGIHPDGINAYLDIYNVNYNMYGSVSNVLLQKDDGQGAFQNAIKGDYYDFILLYQNDKDDLFGHGLHYIYFKKQGEKLIAYNNSRAKEAPINDFAKLMIDGSTKGRFVCGWAIK